MKKNPTSTTEKRYTILEGEFWLNSASEVRRHTLRGEDPAAARRMKKEQEKEVSLLDSEGTSPETSG